MTLSQGKKAPYGYYSWQIVWFSKNSYKKMKMGNKDYNNGHQTRKRNHTEWYLMLQRKKGNIPDHSFQGRENGNPRKYRVGEVGIGGSL